MKIKEEKMKVNLLRGILIALLLATFFIIFNFSSQDAEKSGNISGKVTEVVTRQIKSIQKLDNTKKEETLYRIEKIIRKLAHFSIYTLVGFLLMGLLYTYKLEDRKRILITIAMGVIYATTDEIHQSFIPGRSPQITDVMIDSLGVLCGALFNMLLNKIIMKKYNLFQKIES